MQTFLMYVVIVVLLTPLLLFHGIPFIVAAWLFYKRSAPSLSERTRFVLACGIASLGIAPAFDEHLMPKAIWLVLVGGGSVWPLTAILSFAITWTLVATQLRTVMHLRSHHYV